MTHQFFGESPSGGLDLSTVDRNHRRGPGTRLGTESFEQRGFTDPTDPVNEYHAWPIIIEHAQKLGEFARAADQSFDGTTLYQVPCVLPPHLLHTPRL